ncbi:hypothetical protein GIB67_023209 [Kingdonia uniflora]|uniref:Uncharacterized protein n=1 Tax=Kingdonia uniflora TaxID=39325 RepID=A0A7J7L939_9MAGN|nr:hypothetical protein GIB67_023209 [Kingdonia uniflora]
MIGWTDGPAYMNRMGNVLRIENFGDPMIENDFEVAAGCRIVLISAKEGPDASIPLVTNGLLRVHKCIVDSLDADLSNAPTPLSFLKGEGTTLPKLAIPSRTPIQIRETLNGGITLARVTEPEVRSKEEMATYLSRGSLAPATGSTNMTVSQVLDAAMLAPEEMFAGKGDIKEEVELTREQRKQRRANKKRKFKESGFDASAQHVHYIDQSLEISTISTIRDAVVKIFGSFMDIRLEIWITPMDFHMLTSLSIGRYLTQVLYGDAWYILSNTKQLLPRIECSNIKSGNVSILHLKMYLTITDDREDGITIIHAFIFFIMGHLWFKTTNDTVPLGYLAAVADLDEAAEYD